MANEEAINDAVDVLKKSKATSSSPTTTEEGLNTLTNMDTISAMANANEAVILECSKVDNLAIAVEEMELPENWEDNPMIQVTEEARGLISSSPIISRPESTDLHNTLGGRTWQAHADGFQLIGYLNQGEPNESPSMGFNLRGDDAEVRTEFDLSGKHIPQTLVFEESNVHDQNPEPSNG